MRLVAGFIAVALIPSAFLLYVSGVFLHADINSWFNPEYEQILNDSLEIAKTYYLNSANNASHFARVLAEQIAAQGLLAPRKHEQLKAFINRQQEEYNLGTIEVFSADRKLLLIDISPKTPTGIGASPDSPIISQTLKGQALTRTDRLGNADVIRGSAPIYLSNETDNVLGAVLVDYYLPQSLATRATNISRGSEDYFQLRILRQPIMNSYLLTLVLIGLVVVSLASWFGIFLSRGITGPIKLLARGHSGDRRRRSQLPHPRRRRRRNRPAGRFVQPDDRRSARFRRRARAPPPVHRDPAAQRVRRRRRPRPRRRRHRDQSVRRTAARPEGRRRRSAATTRARSRPLSRARSMTCSLSRTRPREARSTIKLEVAGAETELMMTASPLGDAPNEPAGTVLFFEDVSQIAKVERMEAWREVARRIAHEIKNPLTPIQLSAERLRRQLGARPGIESTLVEECTNTIIGEVEDLKRLVNEFSAFARMPHLNPVPGDINALAGETVANFREANPNVEFVLALDPAIPLIPIDREALKRALVNLLDNAVAAVTAIGHNGAGPKIEVSSHRRPDNSIVTLEVADNGPGIDPRAAHAHFRAVLFGQKGRHRPWPRDRFRRRHRPSWLRPRDRQPPAWK